jgi:2-polyprenyl-3-methyl-5-hydroxy-6-metoxy-1,4-benzoquinol methylase/dienelactone hydrolase
MMYQFDCRLDNDDRNVCTVYLPDRQSRHVPIMVFCHGWGADRRLGTAPRAVLERLIQRGVGMVSLDFYGCGDTGGDYAGMTYGRWTANLEDLVDWVASQDWADPSRIGAWGISSGTTPALRLAELSSKLAWVVSTATCLGLFIGMPNCPPKVLLDNLPELRSGGTARIFHTDFPLAFFTDFIGDAPVYNLDKMTCPVLFLTGGRDNVWRRADALIGYEVLQRHALPVKQVMLEEGGHGLDEVSERAAEEIEAWLAEIEVVTMSEFDHRAGTWDDDPRKKERAEKTAQAIAGRVPLSPRMRALEYGCGTGLLSFALREAVGPITLVDSSRGMIETLERKIAATGATAMTPRLLDLAGGDRLEGEYDLVYTLMTLHHVADIPHLLDAFHGILAPGGYLCIADLDQEDGSFHGAGFRGHHGFAREELAVHLRDAGFGEVSFDSCFVIQRGEGEETRDYGAFLAVCRRGE